jgi:hypothetical protein
MSIRSISINPSDLSIKSKKDKKTKKITQLSEPITINSTNIRKMLLEKLKQHKKTQKNILLNKDNFDNKVPNYSNLKNGTKPTFREWKQTNPIPICPNPIPNPNPIPICPNPNPNPNPNPIPNPIPICPNPIPICPMNDIPIHLDEVDVFDMASKDPYIQEREVKKTFKLGKNLKNKTISILIKSNKTRKNIDQLKRELKNTKLNTIKNFLKTKNLIKFGTSSPSGLLKEIYESSKLCGDVYNNNAKTLIHNYNINNDS